MSLNLTLHTTPDVPVEAAIINPERFNGLDEMAIANLNLQHGNQTVEIGDFFKVSGKASEELHLEGDLSRVKHLGANMSSGKIIVHGNVGQHLGAGMSGGEIEIEGDANDWVGPEMTGGRITIKGNAGHLIGSAYRGSLSGIQGGEIIIHGNVRNELGNAMRNGLIVVGGNAGDFTGVNMLAGTIIVLGEMGIRTGAGMKRGSIISMQAAEMLHTFSYSCLYQPDYLRLYLNYISQLGLDIDKKYITGKYQRWCGDAIELNRGEILLFDQ